jgi:hypothetical protein
LSTSRITLGTSIALGFGSISSASTSQRCGRKTTRSHSCPLYILDVPTSSHGLALHLDVWRHCSTIDTLPACGLYRKTCSRQRSAYSVGGSDFYGLTSKIRWCGITRRPGQTYSLSLYPSFWITVNIKIVRRCATTSTTTVGKTAEIHGIRYMACWGFYLNTGGLK